ncbi:MAG: L,D-transpeptidase, partial [Marmoricola sp.]
DRLQAMTRPPTSNELRNIVSPTASTSARLDPRCASGRALCIDKRTQTLRWVVDGRTKGTYAVRFGASYTPTREGLFHVQFKSANHVSTLYGSAMPYSMFFSGGQAVHYSSDFAARGYAGASHGCVNVRDYPGIKWLFGQVDVGDKVVVYWS